MGLWDQSFGRCLKTYKITRSSLRSGITSCALLADSPPVRAISLGQGKILVGTTNGEVCAKQETGTSNRIEIQFYTFEHLSLLDSSLKLFETLCQCFVTVN